MSSITLIGTGNMARTIGTLAVKGGNTVEIMGRDQAKAEALANTLGGQATTVPGVFAPYSVVVPYWKKYVVAAPFGVTVPVSVAVDCVMLAAAPVVAAGFPAARAPAGAAPTTSRATPAAHAAARPRSLRCTIDPPVEIARLSARGQHKRRRKGAACPPAASRPAPRLKARARKADIGATGL